MADQKSRQPLPGPSTLEVNKSEARLAKTKSADEVKSPPASTKVVVSKRSKIDNYNEFLERVLAESRPDFDQTSI
jgi:hypothetical protein